MQEILSTLHLQSLPFIRIVRSLRPILTEGSNLWKGREINNGVHISTQFQLKHIFVCGETTQILGPVPDPKSCSIYEEHHLATNICLSISSLHELNHPNPPLTHSQSVRSGK